MELMIAALSDLHMEFIEELIIEMVIFVVTAIHGEQWIISLFSCLFG